MASETMNRLLAETTKHVTWVLPAEPAQIRAAQTLRRWDALESMGLVRLRAEIDLDWEPDCDCEDDDCPNKNPESEAFGSIGEFCLPYVDSEGFWQASDSWQHGDSCWGHVGYRDVLDWRQNPYILDIMSETIAAFRKAWKQHVKRRMSQPLSA